MASVLDQRKVKEQDKLITQNIRKYRGRIKRVLFDTYKNVALLIRDGSNIPPDYVFDIANQKMRALLFELYKTITDKQVPKSLEYGRALVKVRKSFKDRLIQKQEEDEPEEDRLAELMAVLALIMGQWVDESSRTRAELITGTTRREIEKIINEGRLKGLTDMQIYDQIMAKANAITKPRADLISETESHDASNKSDIIAIGAIGTAYGLLLKKKWHAVLDNRTREAHAKANGQTVKIGEQFLVGGEALDFPGDYINGSAGNIINCRCVMTYTI